MSNDDLVQYNAPDFGVIPADLLCDQRVSKPARLLGCLLWTYRNKDTGEAWPSQKTLGARLGVSARTVQKYMSELREYGWLTSQHRISVDPTYKGNPGALIHTLHFRTPFSQNKGKPEDMVVSNTTNPSGTTRPSTAQEHTKRTDHKNNDDVPEKFLEAEAKLKTLGITKAPELLEKFSPEKILEKVSYGYTGGMLVTAIERDWHHAKAKGSVEPDYQPGSDFWGK